jgi:hypothetical protein
MVALAEARREAIARNFIVEEENAKILTGMGMEEELGWKLLSGYARLYIF